MKARRFLLVFPALLAVLAGLASPACAQDEPAASAASHATPANASTGDDLVALEHFLSLSDDELAQMQQAIARVRAMSPAERTAMREKIAAYRRLPESQRDTLRLGWGWQSEADRADWPVMMHSLPEEERLALRREILALPAESRAARKHELLEGWRRRQPDGPAEPRP